MTKELKKKLHDISQTFYSWLEKMTVDNWREPVEDPVDTFCNYDDEAGKELARIYSEYENDEETTAEIDRYMNQVVEAVNNGTVVEHRGGARVNAGRKAKPENERRQQLAISCTFEQKAAIVSAAEKEGITTAAYVLRACGVMNCYYCHKELDSKTSKTIFIARCLDGKVSPNPCGAQPVCVCEKCLCEKCGTQKKGVNNG